jgi:hypothetical protein
MVRTQVLSLAIVLAMTTTSSMGQDVVSASTLTRTHTITPAWPQSAAGIEGWVLLPVERYGKKIAQRAEIRMNYALPK